MTQDEIFLEQVRKLISLSDRARQEAETYADDIEDPKLKEEAKNLLEI